MFGFNTPKGEIIFQRRGKNKDTYPGLLDATVGGHVEIGETYESTALAEIKEETGLVLKLNDLNFVKFFHHKSHDEGTGNINNKIQAIFTYLYRGRIEDLQTEKGDATGFEAWPIEKLLNISEEEKKKFIRSIFNEEILGIFRQLQV